MKFDEIRESSDGITRTAILRRDCQTIEIRHVTNRGGNEILCVPSQYGCSMCCGFCGAPELGMPSSIPWGELEPAISLYISTYLAKSTRSILVSFMGCGEPLMNWKNVLATVDRLHFPHLAIRFAMATILPEARHLQFFEMTDEIITRGIDMKMHLSLHFTDDTMRQKWMPGASRIRASIAALEWYHEFAENSVEIHYMMIEDVNTTDADRVRLIELIADRNIPLKLLRFNPKPGSKYRAASPDKAEEWIRYFKRYGIRSEYYETDGVDISAACGMFDRSLYSVEAA